MFGEMSSGVKLVEQVGSEPAKSRHHLRGQLVNLWVDPNFAQTIEFSTKFSETLLRKLILLTESLSVEIANFSH